MKIVIMQPYLFPYLGYFQLIASCDIFISYNSVNYIQRGWINRNKILISHSAEYFTVPVKKSSLGTPINEIEISNFDVFKNKFLKTLQLSYKKAPYFNDVFGMLEELLNRKKYSLISDLAFESIKEICNRLDLKKKFVESSEIEFGIDLDKQQKLDYLIEYFNASEIILPTGSKKLYEEWHPKNCLKKTINHLNISYDQNQREFIENLSIIDVLMFNSLDEIKALLKQYTLE